jgi:hypothetical protein
MAFFGYGLDKRFAGNRFTDFYQLHKAGQPLDRKVNLHKGINWVVWRDSLPALESEGTVPGSSSAENGSPESLSALGEDIGPLPVGRLAGSFIVADSPPWEDLKEYDLVLAVMDPLPSRIYAGAAMYQALKEAAGEGMEILWVVNRDNEAVDHGTLGRFLRLKHFFSVPLIQETCFYESQYGCKLPVEVLLPGGKEKEALEALARNVVTRLGLAGR